MRSNEQYAEVFSSGVTQSNDFSISMTPAMAQLLSKSVYSDNIAATIREPACNAADAAGDTPIRVKLPNQLEPTFIISDDGPGLPVEELMKLYTTYGYSTKRDTNFQVGMFGIGSKAPFAYIGDEGSFTVTSRYGGRIVTCVCYKEQGIPKISLMTDEEWHGTTGLDVIIPVSMKDIMRFQQVAADVLQWIKPRPIITGAADFQLPERNYLATGDGWGLLKRATGYGAVRQGRIVQGNVAYRYENDMASVFSPQEMMFLNGDFDLFFDVGELSPAASRERLNYDERTKKNIKDKVAEVRGEFIKRIREQVLEADSKWKAIIKLNQIKSQFDYQFQNILEKEVLWTDDTRLGNVISMEAVHDLEIQYVRLRHGYRTGRVVWDMVTYVTPSEKTLIIYDDEPDRKRKREIISNYLREGAAKEAYVLRGPSAQTCLKLIGDPEEFIYLSDIQDVQLAKRKARAKIRKVYEYNILTGSFSEVTVDLADPTVGLMVVLNNNRIVRNDLKDNFVDKSTFGAITFHAKRAGILDERIIGIPMSYIKKDVQLENIWEVLEARYKKAMKGKNLYEMDRRLRDRQMIATSKVSHFEEDDVVKDKNSPINILLDIYRSRNDNVNQADDALVELSVALEKFDTDKRLDPKVPGLEIAARRAYPLMESLLWSRTGVSAAFVEYVNAIDTVRKS